MVWTMGGQRRLMEGAQARRETMTISTAPTRVSDPEPEIIVGVDFGAPASPNQQEKKVLAVAAERGGPHDYIVRDDHPFNSRLFRERPQWPGWTLAGLCDELVKRAVSVVGFDFPFGLPAKLMNDPSFARAAQFETGAFARWESLARHLAANLKHEAVLDFTTFENWKSGDRRADLWDRRATDALWKAQPPLKDRYQVLFNMTLAGIAFLWRLGEAGYAIAPFDERTPDRSSLAIEVYPGGFLKGLGLGNYKRRPQEAWTRCRDELIRHQIDLRLSEALVSRCCAYNSSRDSEDHDAMDALVALTITILFREGHCEGLADSPEQQKLEGCIYGPRRGCSTLAEGAPSAPSNSSTYRYPRSTSSSGG